MLGARQIEAALLEDNPTKRPAKLKSWAHDVRLMRERDGRTHEQIIDQFQWANQDSFWRANILSPSKLREKWDQLTARRNSPNGNPANSAAAREASNAATFAEIAAAAEATLALCGEDDADDEPRNGAVAGTAEPF